MKQPVVQGQKLSKQVTTGARILDDVSVDLYPHEVVSIVGPSGAGKSTLLSIVGLLEKPSAGSVFIEGERADNLSKQAVSKIRRTKLGFLFQNIHLMLGLSALHNVMMGLAYSEQSTAEREERAHLLLDRVDLRTAALRRAADLSGGERQRVALARALIREPILLLCDEPTGSLDPTSASAVLEMLHAAADAGTAILMVTHDLSHARKSDRVLEIDGGKIQ